MAKALTTAADALPDGLLKTVLTDPKVARQLAEAGPEVLRALARGDVTAALESVVDNEALRDTLAEAAVKDPAFAQRLEKLGLSVEDLKQAGDALPHLLDAAQALADDDVPGALAALREAATAAPGLTDKAAKAIAGTLPDGNILKDLLNDSALVQTLLTDRDFHGAVQKLLDGDVLGGLADVLRNDIVRDGVLEAVGRNPQVQRALEQAGFTQGDLLEAGEAVPHVLDALKAATGGDWQAALDALEAAGEAAPGVLQKLGETIYEKLPQSVRQRLESFGLTREDLREAPDALPALVDAAKRAGDGDWRGAIDSVLEAGELAPNLATRLLQGVGNALPDSLGLAKQLLADPAVARALASDESLHDSINQLLAGDVVGGVGSLLHNSAVRNAVLEVVAKDPQVSELLGKLGLTSEELIEAGAAAAHLFDAAKALGESDWQAALDALGEAGRAAPNLLKKAGEAIYAQLPAGLREQLSKLAITPETIGEAGAALPHLIDAAKALADGKPLDALNSLQQVLESAPSLVGAAVAAIAKALPDEPALLKTLLSNPDIVRDLVEDPDLRDIAGKLFAGDPVGALRELGEGLRTNSDSPLARHIAEALISDPKISAKLELIGITSADEVLQLGAAMGEVFELVENVSKGDWGAAIKDLGDIASALPDGLKSKIIETLTRTLNLPPAVGSVLAGIVDALGDPEVADAIGDAIAAFRSGNPADWISGLARAGRVIAAESPDLAIGFLDALSLLPGSVGEFFADHELNRIVVESGAFGQMLGAVEKLADGDVAGALGELGSAFGSLLGAGDNYSILGKDLPIGEQGLEAIGRLVGRFIEALPEPIKRFLEQQVASVVAQGGFSSIPFVGPLVGVVGDAIEIGQGIANGEDGLTIGIDVASLVVNGASLFPPFQAAATPLKWVIATGEAAWEVKQLVDEMQDFGDQFAGIAA